MLFYITINYLTGFWIEWTRKNIPVGTTFLHRTGEMNELTRGWLKNNQVEQLASAKWIFLVKCYRRSVCYPKKICIFHCITENLKFSLKTILFWEREIRQKKKIIPRMPPHPSDPEAQVSQLRRNCWASNLLLRWDRRHLMPSNVLAEESRPSCSNFSPFSMRSCNPNWGLFPSF